MKKEYVVPQLYEVLFPSESVMFYVSEGSSAPGEDADAPGRREFTPQFDHGNLI